jgi:hypothetical protein
MDIVFISNQIKYDILNICGMPVDQSYNLLANTPLQSIGYDKDEELCRKLEEKLRIVAEEYQYRKTGNERRCITKLNRAPVHPA